MISIDLSGGCKVEATHDGSRITLACGAVVEGRPHDTDEYRETARKLGYGIEALAMCQDHDPLHALLCGWLGLRDSYALQCAAGLRAEDELSEAEEAAVLAVQRFMRLAGGSLAQLQDHKPARVDPAGDGKTRAERRGLASQLARPLLSVEPANPEGRCQTIIDATKERILSSS